MSKQHPSRLWHRSRALYWFSFIPLSAFLVVSFVSARRLHLEHCGHASASRHTALLLALVLWTSFLTVQVLAGVLRFRQRRAEASSEPPGR